MTHEEIFDWNLFRGLRTSIISWDNGRPSSLLRVWISCVYIRQVLDGSSLTFHSLLMADKSFLCWERMPSINDWLIFNFNRKASNEKRVETVLFFMVVCLCVIYGLDCCSLWFKRWSLKIWLVFLGWKKGGENRVHDWLWAMAKKPNVRTWLRK